MTGDFVSSYFIIMCSQPPPIQPIKLLHDTTNMHFNYVIYVNNVIVRFYYVYYFSATLSDKLSLTAHVYSHSGVPQNNFFEICLAT